MKKKKRRTKTKTIDAIVFAFNCFFSFRFILEYAKEGEIDTANA